MKKYRVRESISDKDREELKEYSPLISHLLFHRGIKTKKDAEVFLNPSYDDHTHDPFLMKNMDIAVDRILKAIENNEKITIFSDYDADGIPGAVILSDFFEKIDYKNFNVYIPHRNKEGFGLNKSAIEKIASKEDGTSLLITIDCGITDVLEVDLANELGLEVIITDHHEPNGKSPNAFTIVNPKIEGCQYPEKMLCGSGVVFKLVQALIKKGNFEIKEGWEKWLLDMVGIATLSDMVPLKGENRVFAHYGLLVLRKSPRAGILQLLKKTRTNQRSLNDIDIGFTIAPRINAASRMGEPEIAFKMLSTKDEVEASSLVSHLDKINSGRKGLVASMVKEIKKHINESNPKNVIACGNPDWKPSLLGLAANSISEEFNKATFLWGRGEGTDLKGSVRGNGETDILGLMEKLTPEILETYGGHKEAGGFVIKLDKVDIFEEKLNELCLSDILKSENYTDVDLKIKLEEVNDRLLNDLETISPFGIGNERPIFLIENIIPEKIESFGGRKEHFKLILKNGYKNIDAIAFYKDTNSWSRKTKDGEAISLIVEIERDRFMGRNKLRLKIIDII